MIAEKIKDFIKPKLFIITYTSPQRRKEYRDPWHVIAKRAFLPSQGGFPYSHPLLRLCVSAVDNYSGLVVMIRVR